MPWSQGKAYGQDLRDRVFALADGGFSVGQVAEQLLVSISYVSKVLSRRRLTGEISARPQRCHVPLKLAGLHGNIATEVAARPDVTIDELRRWLSATHATTASKGLMVKTLAHLGLTHKKRPSMRQNRRAQMLPLPATNGARTSLR
jgi:transposase